MSDKPIRPPFRRPPPRDDGDGPELVRIGEDAPAPDTERVPIPLPHPKALPTRPPAGIVGIRRGTDLQGAVEALTLRVDGAQRTAAEVLSMQRRAALQLDGFGQTVNQRFDIFHEELALLRATVTGDHAPRLEKVESTLGQKAAKGGGLIALALVALPMLADALPKYAHIFDSILGALQ